VRLAREVIFFAVGGVIGLLVDASIVQVLVRELGIDPYLARVPPFLSPPA
jgi:hypothetical protein